jgi:hypothetical protein
MYLHNTNEGTNFALYIWLKLVGGFHGLKMIVCTDLSPIPLLLMKNASQLKGTPLFQFTLHALAP